MARLATRRDALRLGALAAGAAGAGLLAGGLAGCDGGDEDVPAEPASVNPSEGKLGGKLVLYTSCSESLVNAVVPAFMEELGVAVSVVRGKTGELLARVADDAAAGRHVADVVWGGDASWYAGDGETGAANAGLVEGYVSAENGAMREGCGSVGGICTPVTREVVVIALAPERAADGEGDVAGGDEATGSGDDAAAVEAVGPDGSGEAGGGTGSDDAAGSEEASGSEDAAGSDDAVEAGDDDASGDEPKAADAPRVTGYRSLVEVGVEGGVALETPETSDAGLSLAAGIDALLAQPEPSDDMTAESAAGQEADADPNAPWEYLRELLAMASVASEDEVGDGEAALDAVLLGEAGAAIASEQACAVAAREGSGLELVHPEEGLTVTRGCTAIVAGCENLEQARAWVDFVTGQACQQLIASEALGRPVREDVSDPEGLPEVGEAELTEVDRERLVSTWDAVADGTWEPAE